MSALLKSPPPKFCSRADAHHLLAGRQVEPGVVAVAQIGGAALLGRRGVADQAQVVALLPAVHLDDALRLARAARQSCARCRPRSRRAPRGRRGAGSRWQRAPAAARNSASSISNMVQRLARLEPARGISRIERRQRRQHDDDGGRRQHAAGAQQRDRGCRRRPSRRASSCSWGCRWRRSTGRRRRPGQHAEDGRDDAERERPPGRTAGRRRRGACPGRAWCRSRACARGRSSASRSRCRPRPPGTGTSRAR